MTALVVPHRYVKFELHVCQHQEDFNITSPNDFYCLIVASSERKQRTRSMWSLTDSVYGELVHINTLYIQPECSSELQLKV